MKDTRTKTDIFITVLLNICLLMTCMFIQYNGEYDYTPIGGNNLTDNLLKYGKYNLSYDHTGAILQLENRTVVFNVSISRVAYSEKHRILNNIMSYLYNMIPTGGTIALENKQTTLPLPAHIIQYMAKYIGKNSTDITTDHISLSKYTTFTSYDINITIQNVKSNVAKRMIDLYKTETERKFLIEEHNRISTRQNILVRLFMFTIFIFTLCDIIGYMFDDDTINLIDKYIENKLDKKTKNKND